MEEALSPAPSARFSRYFPRRGANWLAMSQLAQKMSHVVSKIEPSGTFSIGNFFFKLVLLLQ